MSSSEQSLQESNINYQSDVDDEIDLRNLLGTLIDGRFIIAVSVCLCMFFGLIFNELSTPIHKADALIQYEDSAPSIPGFDDMTAMFSAESSSLAEIQIIKSRMVIGKVVDDLELATQIKPYYFPVFGAVLARRHTGDDLAEPFLGSSYAWGGEVLKIASLSVPDSIKGEEITLVSEGDGDYGVFLSGQKLLSGSVGQEVVNEDVGLAIKVAELKAHKGTRFAIHRVSRAQAIINLQSSLKILEKGSDTGIIEVSLQGEDQRLIAEIVDSVAANYYLQNILRVAAEAEKSLSFLDEQIPRIGSELVRAEDALNAFRLERNSIDLSLEIRTALESLVQVEADINAMAINEAEISRNFAVEHPSYVAFRRQQADLQAQRDNLFAKLEKLPDTQQKTLRLMRDFEVNQAIYIALQNRRQELSVIKAGTVGKVRVLDQAQVLPKAVSPKKGLVLMLTFLLGCALGVGIVFLRSVIKQGVRDPAVFEALGLSTQAIILESELERSVPKKQMKNGLEGRKISFLLAKEYPMDLTVEALRSLRTSLHFAMFGAKNNVVMISSATPNVGKSFIASNLSFLLSAQEDKRVLLADVDMRRGTVHRVENLAPEQGMSEVLSGSLTIDDAIRKTQYENLDLITRGAIPDNPSELLMGSQMTDFIKRVSADYDIVVLDTPPILAVTDPALIGAHAGTSFMVVRYEHCTPKEVQRSLQRFELSGVTPNGLIFNMVEKKPQKYYYNTGYYQYEYNS